MIYVKPSSLLHKPLSTSSSPLTHLNGSDYQKASHGPDHLEVPDFPVGVVLAAVPEKDMESLEDIDPTPGSAQA